MRHYRVSLRGHIYRPGADRDPALSQEARAVDDEAPDLKSQQVSVYNGRGGGYIPAIFIKKEK